MLLTNLRDEDQEELRPTLALWSRRHPVLGELLTRPIHDLSQGLVFAATCHDLLERERVHEELRRQGGIMLDTRPDPLPAAMVNLHLDLKRCGRL